MLNPKLVAEIVTQIKGVVGKTLPVSVKCRIGIDGHDSWEELVQFIKIVSEEGGVTKFQIHARKCISGLRPKGNRSVPELKYDWVYRLAKEFPYLNFVLNGGCDSIDKAKNILSGGDINPDKADIEGCMVGRLAI